MPIPQTLFKDSLQAIPAMIRNSLIASNPKVKDLDFSELLAIIPVLTVNDNNVKIRLITKSGTGSKYRLESNQTFTFARIDLDTYLNDKGLTERTFTKAEAKDILAYFKDIVTVNTTSGDLTETTGNATVEIAIGQYNGEKTPSYFLEIDKDAFTARDFNVAFKGKVTFTFTGEEVKEPTVDPVPEEPEDKRIDITPYFVNTDLGHVRDWLLID